MPLPLWHQRSMAPRWRAVGAPLPARRLTRPVFSRTWRSTLCDLRTVTCAVAMAFLPSLDLLHTAPALAITVVLWWAGARFVV